MLLAACFFSFCGCSSFFFFFFSSRRRHTRCLSDWSSDVCSSDLSVRASGLCSEAANTSASGLMRQFIDVPASPLGRRSGELHEMTAVVLRQHVHRSEEHTSELQSLRHLVCRLLLEKKKLPSTTAFLQTLPKVAEPGKWRYEPAAHASTLHANAHDLDRVELPRRSMNAADTQTGALH